LKVEHKSLLSPSRRRVCRLNQKLRRRPVLTADKSHHVQNMARTMAL
jgi:hypothetical protein